MTENDINSKMWEIKYFFYDSISLTLFVYVFLNLQFKEKYSAIFLKTFNFGSHFGFLEAVF